MDNNSKRKSTRQKDREGDRAREKEIDRKDKHQTGKQSVWQVKMHVTAQHRMKMTSFVSNITIVTIHSHHTAHISNEIETAEKTQQHTLKPNEQIILDTFACSERRQDPKMIACKFATLAFIMHIKQLESGVFSYRFLSLFSQANRFYVCSFDVWVFICYTLQFVAVFLSEYGVFCSSRMFLVTILYHNHLHRNHYPHIVCHFQAPICGRMATSSIQCTILNT